MCNYLNVLNTDLQKHLQLKSPTIKPETVATTGVTMARNSDPWLGHQMPSILIKSINEWVIIFRIPYLDTILPLVLGC